MAKNKCLKPDNELNLEELLVKENKSLNIFFDKKNIY
jgi:hypothetical protein